MALGGSGRVRRTRPLMVALVAGALLVPVVGPTTALAGRSDDDVARRYRGGDAGTGVPSFREGGPAVTARSTIRWSDVSSADAWARPAIDHVAGVKT